MLPKDEEGVMAKARVKKLRYVGLAAPNYDAALTFFEDAWRLKKVEEESGFMMHRSAFGNTFF